MTIEYPIKLGKRFEIRRKDYIIIGEEAILGIVKKPNKSSWLFEISSVIDKEFWSDIPFVVESKKDLRTDLNYVKGVLSSETISDLSSKYHKGDCVFDSDIVVDAIWFLSKTPFVDIENFKMWYNIKGDMPIVFEFDRCLLVVAPLIGD